MVHITVKNNAADVYTWENVSSSIGIDKLVRCLVQYQNMRNKIYELVKAALNFSSLSSDEFADDIIAKFNYAIFELYKSCLTPNFSFSTIDPNSTNTNTRDHKRTPYNRNSYANKRAQAIIQTSEDIDQAIVYLQRQIEVYRNRVDAIFYKTPTAATTTTTTTTTSLEAGQSDNIAMDDGDEAATEMTTASAAARVDDTLLLRLLLITSSDKTYRIFDDDKKTFDANTENLIFAKKRLDRAKQLCDYVGKNEKTKVTVAFEKESIITEAIDFSNIKMTPPEKPQQLTPVAEEKKVDEQQQQQQQQQEVLQQPKPEPTETKREKQQHTTGTEQQQPASLAQPTTTPDIDMQPVAAEAAAAAATTPGTTDANKIQQIETPAPQPQSLPSDAAAAAATASSSLSTAPVAMEETTGVEKDEVDEALADLEELEDEEVPRVTKKQLEMLENSASLRKMLKDERLQTIILDIDKTENDREREHKLQEAMANLPEFEDFVHKMLVTIGVREADEMQLSDNPVIAYFQQQIHEQQ